MKVATLKSGLMPMNFEKLHILIDVNRKTKIIIQYYWVSRIVDQA